MGTKATSWETSHVLHGVTNEQQPGRWSQTLGPMPHSHVARSKVVHKPPVREVTKSNSRFAVDAKTMTTDEN